MPQADLARGVGGMAMSGLPLTLCMQRVWDEGGVDGRVDTVIILSVVLFSSKKKKKKNKCKWTTLSYSLWIISEESQHHCGGPKVILLPTPLGVSRSLTLDEPKNSLTPPSHSIRNHLWTDNLLPFWSITVSWMASWTSYGFGHTGWECQVHSLRLMVQRHSKCLQCPSLLAWPVASGPLGRLPDSLWDATPPKDWRTQLHGSHNTLIVG